MKRRKKWAEILADEDAGTPRYWKPLVETPPEDFHEPAPELVSGTAKHYGMTEDGARAFLAAYHARCRYFTNDIYQVQVEEYHPGCLHLNIRRRDGGMVRDWRHFQEIKNQIAGPEREGVELYPAESRKVDTTNKWHIWVQPEGVKIGVGWDKRDVTYDSHDHVPGLRQRPL